MSQIPISCTGDTYLNNLSAPFFDNARRSPSKMAVVYEGQQLSNADLVSHVDIVIDILLEKGVEQGDRVAYFGLNHPLALVIYFAVARVGAVYLPLNPRCTAKEVQFFLNDCEARFIFASADFQSIIDQVRGELPCQSYLGIDVSNAGWDKFSVEGIAGKNGISKHAMVQTNAEDPGMLLYTSGTTGRAKGVVTSHRAVWATSFNMTKVLQITRNTNVLAVAPMYHVGTLATAVAAISNGGSVVIQQQFEPAQVCQAVEDWNINLMFAVPTMLQVIEQTPGFSSDAFDGVSIIIGGAPVPVALIKHWGEMGAHILQVYGMTEGGGTLLDYEMSAHKQGSAGLPMPLTEIRLKDLDSGAIITESGLDGEIQMRSKTLTSGYWNLPEQTAEVFDEEGWLSTGDVGSWDADGYLYIVDRIKDMIISGGMNVYPAEVEKCISDFPQVAQAAVIGLPDSKWGEMVAVAVVPKIGETIDEEELIEYSRKTLSGYKVPRKIIFVDALPIGPTGKVIKRELKEQLIK